MKLWKNTPTLDVYVPALLDTVDASEAEVAVIGGKSIDLDTLPHLKGIFKCGVGTDNVPFEEADKRGIAIGLPSEATKRYIYEETANFAVYLILRMLYSEVGDLENWKKYSRCFLGERKVLVVGKGNIGSHVVRKLDGLVDVLTFDALENRPEELKGLMKAADVVTLHVPMIEETKNFMDAEKLSWMKDGSILINTARGPIVDEDALYEEIANDRLRAAFDVFWKEPYNGKLKEFHPDRFLMTPHISSHCENFLVGLGRDLEAFISSLAE